MPRLDGVEKIQVYVHEAHNLDTVCFRGEAPLAHLTMVSQADIHDQITNPEGLQRDLSPKHASDAYEYVRRQRDPQHPRAYPEVMLNVRDKRVADLEQVEVFDADRNPIPGVKIYRLSIDRSKMRPQAISVSRLDGNHRLEYGAGDDRREPLLASIPFQLHIGLTRDQERHLFVDVNANQKGLNTSHLAIQQSMLTPEQVEIRDHLDRWIAKRLTNDPGSPWHGIVHLGGSKKGSRAQGLARAVNFASLQAGVGRTLAKSQYLHDLTDPQAQYAIIRNYWRAVRSVFAQEWASPKQYLLAKNIGVMSLSILGGTIIDRCLARGRYEVADFGHYLAQARSRFDWSSDAMGERSIAGMSGNRAAQIIAGEMTGELSDDTGTNLMRELQERLLAEPT